jgi:4,5-DOPA dioxygenase extradiol
MKRLEFIKYMAGVTGMIGLGSFKQFTDDLPVQEQSMPVLFIGHGSPMNAIENNAFTLAWQQLGKTIPKPKAVLCVSAHWLTQGTYVTAMPLPKTIHDFGGFPNALFDVQYPASGQVEMATLVKNTIHSTPVGLDLDWGLDHGTWSILKHIYPLADVPVLQLSIDFKQPMNYHYQLAKELAALRKKGVLIIGSGNMVHNLANIAWDKFSVDNYAYDWAIEMNTLFKQNILQKNHQALVNYNGLSKYASLAIPTPDHYIPLLYTLGLQTDKDQIAFFNDQYVAGSLSMTSVYIGEQAFTGTLPVIVKPTDTTSKDTLI